jgi:hypothetical protein
MNSHWNTLLFLSIGLLAHVNHALPPALAHAQGKGHCDLCKRSFTFILGTGRSGSTTVLEMLNQLDGYALTGEHSGLMLSFMDVHKRFQRTQANRAFLAFQHSKREEITHLCGIQDWILEQDSNIEKNIDYRKTTRPRVRKVVYGFKVSRFLIFIFQRSAILD